MSLISGIFRRVAGVRNTRCWLLFRPFFRVVNRFFNVEQAMGDPFGDEKAYQAEKKRQLKEIRRTTRKMQLGFIERPRRELDWYVNGPATIEARREAAWQLAQWHSNGFSRSDAAKTFSYLERFDTLAPVNIDSRELAILKVETLLRQERWNEAWGVTMSALTEGRNSNDLMLSAANLFVMPEEFGLSSEEGESLRLDWMNSTMRERGLDEIGVLDQERGLLFDNLSVSMKSAHVKDSGPLVTVIMAAYNAEAFIETSIRSLLDQSWRNIEILVVDDASSDSTGDVVADIARREGRIRLIRNEHNCGDSCARNIGLREAKGEFVTLQDADDFGHSRKIEIQVEHLIANPGVIANRSMQVRATNNLEFVRKGTRRYVRPNLSSIMFRREPVVNKIGYWDSVRYSGDSEFFARMRQAFGRENIVDLEDRGILTIVRHHEASLSSSPATGYHGFHFGARREYEDAFRSWHERAKSLYVDFPQTERPFAIAHTMKCESGRHPDRRVYDVILASDFRLPGGTTSSNIEEIRAQAGMDITSGIVQLSWYRENPERSMNDKVRRLMDQGMADIICYPEEVEARLVIFRYPPAIVDKQRWMPKIRAHDVRIICNQPPVRGSGELSEGFYSIEEVDRRVMDVFGVRGTWHPIGPVARMTLEEAKADVKIGPDDWVNLINIPDWSDGRTGPVNEKPVIGRHGRDHFDKWPSSAEELRLVYPDGGDIQVRMLGGAENPRRLLGRIPENWKVYEFDEISPKEYLAGIDVFVNFPDPRRYEAFGRTIFEAMAVGAPVILPHSFKDTFGEAALYCESAEVIGLVKRLCSNPGWYRELVEQGRAYVENNYGYHIHRSRLEWLLRRPVKAKDAPER